MRAAIVTEPGDPPVYGEFDDPVPRDGEEHVSVRASALTNFVRARAAGRHHSSSTPPPFVPGIDGVGRRPDGRRVYFLFPRPPFGGMAEATVVPAARCIPLPDDLDDITAAAIADPGMSAWVALQERARMRSGETVLVNGATGSAGGLAVQIAKHLGAATVIATGRNRAALDALLSRGADEVVDLTIGEAALQSTLQNTFARGVDVVLDYLWGPSTEHVLTAVERSGRATVPTRLVQIGTAAAPAIALRGTVLRSSAVEITGSGIGSVDAGRITTILATLMRTASTAGFHVATRRMPLVDVARAWATEPVTPRIVLTTDHHDR